MNSIGSLTEKEIKIKLLLAEATRWEGVKEEGENTGQIVRLFQNWDGSPDVVPWCMAFVQFCTDAASHYYNELTGMCSQYPNRLWPSEHCMTVWARTMDECKTDKPEVGSIVIWSHYKNGKPTGAGHAGIVIRVLSNGNFETIEGNTSDGTGLNREGEGVYRKYRVAASSEGFVLLGFIKPFGG